MKNLSAKYLAITTMAISLLLAGCSLPGLKQNTQPAQVPENTNSQPVGLANPASQNCIAKGGKLVIQESKQGQYGVCFFEDNRQCEEWALLRGQCPVGGLKITGYQNDAEVYCVITGGTIQDLGSATPMCKRTDGTLCTAQANFDGQCPDPNNPEPNAGNVEFK